MPRATQSPEATVQKTNGKAVMNAPSRETCLLFQVWIYPTEQLLSRNKAKKQHNENPSIRIPPHRGGT